MEGLARILEDKITKEGLSVREAARQIGIAHTTLGRVIEGASCDVDTLIKFSEWLGVPASTLIDLGDQDDLASHLSAFIRQYPELADVLGDAVSRAVAGEVDVATIRDLVAYISFRLGTRER